MLVAHVSLDSFCGGLQAYRAEQTAMLPDELP